MLKLFEYLKKLFIYLIALFFESRVLFRDIYLTAFVENQIISKGKHMSIIARIDQVIVLKPGFTDALGNPVSEFGSTPKWSVSDTGLATLTVSDDGLSAEVTPTGILGTVQVSMTVDTDPGEADIELVAVAEIVFKSGKAAIVTLSSTVQDKPIATSAPVTTDTPVFTEAPTDAPVATDAPTDAPVNTDAPTDTPVATDDPATTPAPDAGDGVTVTQ